MKRKTSFLKAILSRDAREQRQKEIQDEIEAREKQKKKRAQIEATCLSVLIALFGTSMSMAEGLTHLGLLLILSAFLAWSPLYNLSMRHGPLLKGTPARRRIGEGDQIFYGPRGGRFRMSADKKRRIYF